MQGQAKTEAEATAKAIAKAMAKAMRWHRTEEEAQTPKHKQEVRK